MILPLLLAQYRFSRTIEEPYPAALMPRFSGAPAKMTISKFQVVFRSPNHASRHLSKHEVFAHAPKSYRSAMLGLLYARSATGISPELEEWLRRRSLELTDRDDVHSLEIQKLQVAQALLAPELAPETSLLETRTIILDPRIQ